MITLKGDNIYLRALEPEDLEFVLSIENNESLWKLSNTQTPFSRYSIKEYLLNAHKDIYEVKQLRLVISDHDNNSVGLIDMFDFDFKNKRAGVGIVISDKLKRHKGYGREALKILIKYAFVHLDLHQLYCNISEENEASISLFKGRGFKKIGLKRDWTYEKGKFHGEILFQLINQ